MWSKAVFVLAAGAAASNISQRALFSRRDGIPEIPSTPSGLNGVKWPDMVINKDGGHFFGIGDWGGVGHPGDTWANPKITKRRKLIDADKHAQGYVANVMKKRAPTSQPDYVLNVGDNFYPGGYTHGCSSKDSASSSADHDTTHQFQTYFYNIYNGPGLDGKPWLSCLGNHDYGGIGFRSGWDAQIYRTWSPPESSGGQWVMPGQFWWQTIKYNGFDVDVFMLDSNFHDGKKPGHDKNHNICQGHGTCYGVDQYHCSSWLHTVWDESKDMLRKGLASSQATWKIVVTHFPGSTVAGDLSEFSHQIDLLFTGHQHDQKAGNDHGIDWIISGGGGGVSSDGHPSYDGHDDAYGFVDFTISKTELKYEMLSWGGPHGDFIIRNSKTLTPKSSRLNTANTTIVV